MQLTFIRDGQAFDALSQTWNELLGRSATNVPFLRHEYLRGWWSTLGGGEWAEADLCIGVGRDHAGELAGLAPLFLTQNSEGRASLMFLGSIEISDYLDLITPSDAVRPFAECLLEALAEKGPSGWELLDLCNIPEASPSLQALQAAAEKRGWEIKSERLQPCPALVLPPDWESYLNGLDKKQRHEIRRKIRRVESYSGSVNYRIIDAEKDIEGAMETFMDMMASDPHKAGFLATSMRLQFQLTARAAFENGWLQLALLEIDGVAVAGYMNFDYGNRIWIYNSGVNVEYSWLSPGWVLLAYLVQWAIEHGRDEVDFLRGDEVYKYRFGGVDRSIARLVIDRGSRN